jgi:PTH1 family peptidyl-tRNA hydrolase
MKYLIVGLGNIGDEYKETRHNIGFTVLDRMALAFSISFTDRRYGQVCEIEYRGRKFILLKPSTYMNLSGNAVRYWMKKEKIQPENLLVIVDDIALPAGSFRMRLRGSDGGHNGLAHISTTMATTDYARIRIGIGNGFSKGSQVNYVLGTWLPEEKKSINERISVVIDMILSFGVKGPEMTMTTFNRAGKNLPADTKTDPSSNSVAKGNKVGNNG